MSEAAHNKAVLKEAFDLWHKTKGGCTDHWLSIMSEEIKFKSLADGADGAEFTARIKSQNDMKRYFEGLSTAMEMIFYRVDHYIAEGDKVVAVGRTSWRVKANGIVLDTPKCDVVTFKKGKIIAFYEYYDTASLLKAHEAQSG